MHKNWLTFFLVLTLLIPVGVFGSVRHSCLMKEVGQLCAHLDKSDHSTHNEAGDAGAANCEFRAAPEDPPAVGKAREVQLDSPQPAEPLPLFSATFHSSTPSDKTLPDGVRLLSPGGEPPLFIRYCSLLN